MPVNPTCPWKHVIHTFICLPFLLWGMGFSPSAFPTPIKTCRLGYCVASGWGKVSEGESDGRVSWSQPQDQSNGYKKGAFHKQKHKRK